MSKITLSRITTLINAPTAINGVLTQIENAFERVLFRDLDSSNQMTKNLDMNSKRILNLPLPSSQNEPLRLKDLESYSSELPGLVVDIQTIADSVHTDATNVDSDAAAVAADRIAIASDKAAVLAAVGSLPINNYHPESYGCLGNGVANDTVNFRACIAAAGVNGVIELKPNATYMVCGGLTLLAGQTVIGNGATIKRMAQPTPTTTSTELVNGVTTIFTVASASGLVVGMDLVAASHVTARADLVAASTLSTTVMRITNIVGTSVTVSTAPNCSLASGAKIINSFETLQLASNCKVFNLTIDGNKAARTWSRWEVDAEFETLLGSEYCTISHCRIINAAAEGISAFGNYHLFHNNSFSNLNGNGIHLSASVHTSIVGNTLITGNLDIDCGHADGAIIWSNGITDATIIGNYCQSFISGIGSFDNTDTDATVSDNTIRDCYCWGIYTAAGAARLVATNNRITNCATNTALLSGLGYSSFGGVFGNSLSSSDFCFEQNQLDGPFYIVGVAGQTRLTVKGNIIRGSTVSIFYGVNDFVIDGNIFVASVHLANLKNGVFSANEINITGDTSSIALSLYNGSFDNISISDNIVVGGANNAGVDSSTTITNVQFIGNKFTDGSLRGLVCSPTSGTIDIVNNQITASTNSTSSWTGLVNFTAGANICSNRIFNNSGSDVSVGLFATPGNSKTLIKDNVVRGTYTSAPLSIASTGAFVASNALNGSIVDTGSGNTVSGTISL